MVSPQRRSAEVELVRRLYGAFAGGDFAAAVLLVDPEIELQPPAASPEERTYRGYEAVLHHLTELRSPFDAVGIEPQEFIEAGNQQVVVILRVAGRGKSSGFEFETLFGHVLTLREGRVTRLQAFLDPNEALRAVGLEAKPRAR